MSNPFEQFDLVRFIGVRVGNLDLSWTNESLFMCIGVFFMLFCSRLILNNGGKVIPSRWQSIWEMCYVMVLKMSYESIGKSKGGEFVSFGFGLFSFILICNIVGLVPYSYTATAQLIVTFTIALGIWVGKLLIGVSAHGWKLGGIFIPSGAPFAMVPFFVFIEVLSFVIPLISLSVRLFANMMSGHVLLKVLFGFSWSMMTSGGLLLMVGHLVPLVVLYLLMGLELAVGVIQAYVFTLLMFLYIGDMVKGGH